MICSLSVIRNALCEHRGHLRVGREAEAAPWGSGVLGSPRLRHLEVRGLRAAPRTPLTLSALAAWAALQRLVSQTLTPSAIKTTPKEQFLDELGIIWIISTWQALARSFAFTQFLLNPVIT